MTSFEGMQVPVVIAPAVVPVMPRVVSSDFNSFFAESRRSMVGLAILMVGSVPAAEEIVQDAFVAAFERWDRIENPGGYVRVAVVNRCRSWHRARIRVGRRRTPDRPDAVLDDRGVELMDVLATLPHRRRAVVVLRYFEQMTTTEIAALLRISEGTVKSTLHRGLAQLRGHLE